MSRMFGVCVPSLHDADHEVPRLICVMCGDKACSECGRDPEVSACAICDREMCSTCRVDELCPACQSTRSGDRRAGEDQFTKELALAGAAVLTGFDTDATTVLLDRGSAIEQVVIGAGPLMDGLSSAGASLTTLTSCVSRPVKSSVHRLFPGRQNRSIPRCRMTTPPHCGIEPHFPPFVVGRSSRYLGPRRNLVRYAGR